MHETEILSDVLLKPAKSLLKSGNTEITKRIAVSRMGAKIITQRLA